MFSNMDYIYEVYQQGSISKAAANLYISQPSLSASIKRVEEKIGYPLFDRGTRPLKLTEIGQKYIESVQAIRSIEKDFGNYIDDYGGLKAGTIRLGGTNLVASLLAPKLIARFHQIYPNIQIILKEAITSELGELLEGDGLDMVIDYALNIDETFESRKLTDEQLILTVPKSFSVNEGLEEYRLDMESIKNHSFMDSAVPGVPLKRFKDVPFIMLMKKNDTYKRAYKLCLAAGFEPVSVFEAAQQMTAYHVCCSGYGVAFVSSLLLSGVTPNGGVYWYKLAAPEARRHLSILWSRERYYSKAMQEFTALAEQSFQL